LPTAYVLLNTEIGTERDVLKILKKIEGVQEAFGLFGIYDIIAKVRADTMAKLTQILNNQFRISEIHPKMTVIVTKT
jgi:DNA-binding Lrp family transcriptional regulator